VSERLQDVERHVPATPDDATRSVPIAELEATEESLRHFLELIRLLDERGVLRLLSDLLEDNEELVRVSVDWLSRPENVRAIQNLRALARAVQEIDPAKLETVATSMARAVDRAADVPVEGERRGAFAVLRQLGEPDVNRGFRVFLEFLRSLGQSGAPPPGK